MTTARCAQCGDIAGRHVAWGRRFCSTDCLGWWGRIHSNIVTAYERAFPRTGGQPS